VYEIDDDLLIYKDNFYRSSEFTLHLWEIIESKILYILGIFETGIITIYFDNENISISASSDFVIIINESYNFFLQNCLCNMTDFTACIMITFVKSKKFSLNYEKCLFYYEEGNTEDEGDIEAQIDILGDISSFDDIKASVLSKITKELQYLVHKNYFQYKIKKSKITNLDVEYEYYSLLSKVYKKDLKNILAKKNVNCVLQKYILELEKRIKINKKHT